MGKKKKSKIAYASLDPRSRKPSSMQLRELEKRVKKAYKVFGDIDYSHNYLEVLTPALLADIWAIFKHPTDNHTKANLLDELLEPYGFYELGLGTNVCTFENENEPGVVYKIALDPCGLADNRNDPYLPTYAPEANPPKVIDMTPDALVSVQEYVYAIREKEDMFLFWKEALEICESLSKRFLVIDVTPMMFANWAIGRDMKLRTCDVSDLFPLPKDQDLFRCKSIVGEKKKSHKLIRCNGRLYYDENYQWMYCSKCGKKFLPSELRPKPHIWDESEMRGIGYTDPEWLYMQKRADRFAYFDEEARMHGLIAEFECTPQLTPLPDSYRVRPMTDKELTRMEAKLDHPIKRMDPDNFHVEFPDDLKDFSDKFYRKHGRLPRRVDKNTQVNFKKLLEINPKLANQYTKVTIGTQEYNLYELIGIESPLNQTSTMTNDSKMSSCHTKQETHSLRDSQAPRRNQIHLYDEKGMKIGSEERKEYYRNLEVNPPLFHMENGKRVFYSKEAQIIWVRGNSSPRAFANTVYNKYKDMPDPDGVVMMLNKFEQYFPDANFSWYAPVAIPDELEPDFDKDDSASNVDTIPLAPADSKLSLGSSSLTKESLKESLSRAARERNRQRDAKSSEQTNSKVTSIPLDDVPMKGGEVKHSSVEVGAAVADKTTGDSSVVSNKSPNVNLTEVNSQGVPSWSSKPKLSSAGPDEISVSDITVENADLDLSMNGHEIDLDFDVNSVNDLMQFFKSKAPKICISFDEGETYSCEIKSEHFGAFLGSIVTEFRAARPS